MDSSKKDHFPPSKEAEEGSSKEREPEEIDEVDRVELRRRDSARILAVAKSEKIKAVVKIQEEEEKKEKEGNGWEIQVSRSSSSGSGDVGGLTLTFGEGVVVGAGEAQNLTTGGYEEDKNLDVSMETQSGDDMNMDIDTESDPNRLEITEDDVSSDSEETADADINAGIEQDDIGSPPIVAGTSSGAVVSTLTGEISDVGDVGNIDDVIPDVDGTGIVAGVAVPDMPTLEDENVTRNTDNPIDGEGVLDDASNALSGISMNVTSNTLGGIPMGGASNALGGIQEEEDTGDELIEDESSDEEEKEVKGKGDKEEGGEGEEEEPDFDDEGEAEGGDEPEEPLSREHNLPDKPTFFQVRVRIIKACHLPGINIDPAVRITVDNQKKQTRGKKHVTASKPEFNETFFFNFNEKPDDMFNKLLQIQAINTKGLLSSTPIGSFMCDVGTIYFQKDHSVVKKWVLLSAVEDANVGGVGRKSNTDSAAIQDGTPAGYVQITAAILGPGDELPDSAKSDSITADDVDGDLETNLWIPGGVKLTPATFSMKIYRVEDLPQMDSSSLEVAKVFKSKKRIDRCDPFCKVQFAGKTIKTSIKTNSYNPEYNEELKIPFKFPSMCDKIQFQVFDWDRVGDDEVVGTTSISLSQISSLGGSDFLPSFGPCYVNFFGSAREFSVLSSDFEQAMDEGKEKGAYYRGRALLELSTKLGGSATTPKQSIKHQALLKVRPCLRRRKYKLFATFISANGISDVDDRVHFEVSIGNYGNSLDNHGEALASTTPPVMPKFDGTQYYYIPWNASKPCCAVENSWEDILFRLEPMNRLRNIAFRLEENLGGLDLAVKLNNINNSHESDTALLVLKILDDLIADCNIPLPQLNERTPGVTKLDLKLQGIRLKGLKSLQHDANELKIKSTDVEDAIVSLKGFFTKLKDLSHEPQNSLPDIVISMLKDDKRIAYSRISSEDVFFSKNPACKGIHCARQQHISFKVIAKNSEDADVCREVPTTCEIILWLGLEEDQSSFVDANSAEGKYSVVAETYENQLLKPIIGWSSDGCPRPAFSDAEGDVRLNKEFFKPPKGWVWDEEDWSIALDNSLVEEADEGRSDVLVSVYENQSMSKKGMWLPALEPFTEAEVDGGKTLQSKDDVILPEKWEWSGDWSVDSSIICDEEGWEYKAKVKGKDFNASVKPNHKFRRRKLVRKRIKIIDESTEKKDASAAGGWVYAVKFGKEYHLKEKKSDMVRRRKWCRRMVALEIGHAPIFKIPEKKKTHKIMPNMMLAYKDSHRWQLRAYIYQARNMIPMDDDGMSDPYAYVTFQHKTKRTRIIKKTLSPEWDETLMFENLVLYGSPQSFLESTPLVCVNFYDEDLIGRDEYSGRCLIRPVVRLEGTKSSSIRLLWYPIMYNGKEHGQLLAAFELFLDEGMDLPFTPPIKDGRLIVPNGIRPVIVKTGFEVLCWGVRNLKKYQLAACTSPSVSIEVGSYIIQSDVIKNTKKNPNFNKNVYFQELFLPKEPLYMPPINIIVRDHRSFGRKPIIGTHVITNVLIDDPPRKCDATVDTTTVDLPVSKTTGEAKCKETALTIDDGNWKIGDKKQKLVEETSHLDWWAKYYASSGECNKCGAYLEDGYRTIQIYKTELEKVEVFGQMNDFVDTFQLERGHSNDDDEDGSAGQFKGLFKIYPLHAKFFKALSGTRYFSKIKSSKPEECIVRVYIIRAFDLTPKDDNGLADPYISIKLGNKKVTTKDRYIPNELNPFFGEYFEFKCRIPIEKDLKVKLYDYDLIGRDDLIGQTTIDLENRVLTKTRATVGLPPSYFVKGPYMWRDSKKPKEILDSLAQSQPVYVGEKKVIVNENEYELCDFEDPLVTHGDWGPCDERLALHVLHTETFGGVKLVPEHVETRTLIDPLEPNMSQGRLEMFVDIFPVSLGSPGSPVVVTPRQPKSYELRVVIWNTADVPCIDTNISGEEMVDIFLKGWLVGYESKVNKTDVHYNSMKGDGMFNWRMLFPVQYIPEENVMVVEEKEHFWSLDKTKKSLPPKLVIQVWDHDLFSPDEYIGMLELNLNKLLLPMKRKNQCSVKMLHSKKPEYVDLFQTKIAKGWWVMSGENAETGDMEEKGKVEMTLEILTKELAEENVAGKGREEPNMHPPLEKPDRPKNRFNFMRNPFKAIFCMVWRRYKWLIMGLFFLALVIICLALFGYYAIGYGTKKLMHA